jgi:hypothetical protein
MFGVRREPDFAHVGLGCVCSFGGAGSLRKNVCERAGQVSKVSRAAFLCAMSKQLENIDSELTAWIHKQRIFFVATAPHSPNGHVNVSPKGGESFRVLGLREVAYQDYTGSGAESAAHLRENGRIVIMFCAFDGAPKIVRLHGRGSVITPDHSRFSELSSLFPPHPGTRAFIHVAVSRVSSSCGYAVPFFDFRGHRDALDCWSATQGPEKLEAYRATKNQRSIDGLPAFTETPRK